MVLVESGDESLGTPDPDLDPEASDSEDMSTVSASQKKKQSL